MEEGGRVCWGKFKRDCVKRRVNIGIGTDAIMQIIFNVSQRICWRMC